ncbi:hypothetical protein HDU85_002674 [Gaertneriomyces sp. JEL0708]|nr:hypothetical protein HDU85_002674 [Gaertneriomyces sp. JEL0708]
MMHLRQLWNEGGARGARSAALPKTGAALEYAAGAGGESSVPPTPQRHGNPYQCVTLRWLRPANNERVLIRFQVAQSLKSTLPGDKRFIFFVDEGIAIKDEMDRWMTIGKRRAATTVIVKAETMDLGSPRLQQCWQYERVLPSRARPRESEDMEAFPMSTRRGKETELKRNKKEEESKRD